MPVITREEALEQMIREVRDGFAPDELLEVYNEVFRGHRATQEEADRNPEQLRQRLIDHFNTRQEMEEITALWEIVFIKQRNVWYNEEDDRIHYNEEEEAAPFG